MHDAAFYGHTDVLDVLLFHGGSVSARDRGGRLPVELAELKHRADCVALLKRQPRE